MGDGAGESLTHRQEMCNLAAAVPAVGVYPASHPMPARGLAARSESGERDRRVQR